MAKQFPFPVAVGGDDDTSPSVAVGVMPVDPDSDSDKEHPLHEPQFVFHAVDGERRRGPALLPIPHRRPWAVADDEREKRLRECMIFPQAVLFGATSIFGVLMMYLVINQDELRAQQPGFNWDACMMTSSVLVMVFSLVSLVVSHLGVYYYDGCQGLND